MIYIDILEQNSLNVSLKHQAFWLLFLRNDSFSKKQQNNTLENYFILRTSLEMKISH